MEAMGVILTVVAVLVAGLAAALGIWMERDPNRPPRWAYGLTVLIFLATLVTVATSYIDFQRNQEDEAKAEERHATAQSAATERYELLKRESGLLQESAAESKKREEKMSEDIARMLVSLNAMAASSNDPALNAFVTEELNSAARADPKVVERVAQRLKDDGQNPDEVLAKRLPAAELQRVARIAAAKPASFARPAGLRLPGVGGAAADSDEPAGAPRALPLGGPGAGTAGAAAPRVPVGRGGAKPAGRIGADAPAAPAAPAAPKAGLPRIGGAK